MSNYPSDLDYIQLVQGGQLMLQPSDSNINGKTVTVTEVKGDETGALYVMNGVTLGLQTQIEVSLLCFYTLE